MNDLEISHRKHVLRTTIRNKRRRIQSAQLVYHSTSIHALVHSLPEWLAASTYCLYVSAPDEISTQQLLDELLLSGKTVAVPRITTTTFPSLHHITSRDDLQSGPYGIFEPKATIPVLPSSDIDLFIVPSLAVDLSGYRLGRGKGFYDRLLSTVTVPRITFLLEQFVVPQIPHLSYDVPVTTIITQKRIISIAS